jgi:ankyrin repeat protein
MGHIEVVKLLLEKGARPNFEDEPGRTPLSRASHGSHTAVIKLLNFYCTLEVPCNNPIPKPRTNVSINAASHNERQQASNNGGQRAPYNGGRRAPDNERSRASNNERQQASNNGAPYNGRRRAPDNGREVIEVEEDGEDEYREGEEAEEIFYELKTV